MRRSRLYFPFPTFTAAVALAVVGLIWIVPKFALADDRELLQFDSGQPYLFILLDSSASMAHKIGTDNKGNEVPTPGYGDDPESRLYAAKEALHTVFNRPEFLDVRFGFATFPNQDEGKVRRKHWLYYAESRPSALEDIGWPDPAPKGPYEGVDTDGDGTVDDFVRVANADTAVVSFGPHPWNASNNVVTQVGSCSDPLDLNDPTDFLRFNAFPKLGFDSTGTVQETTAWVLGKDGSLYELVFTRPGNKPDGSPNATVGEDPLHVSVEINWMDKSTCGEKESKNANLKLLADEILNEYLITDQADIDTIPGLVTAGADPWSDAEDAWTCGAERPFTGLGWEGNYDSGKLSGDSTFDDDVTVDDAFCLNGGDPNNCPSDKLVFNVKPTATTNYSETYGRALDSGDMLPFHWKTDNRTAVFGRLAPNGTDFGIARYYVDDPTSSAPGDGHLAKVDGTIPEPLIAMGDTPISSAGVDLRCWYEGKDGHNKCKKDPDFPFQDGWWEWAACNDPDYGCWRPFFIIISDGDENCGAVQDPTAVSAGLKSATGVKIWAVNVGNPKNCKAGSVLKTMAQNTEGECVNVDTKQELVDTIADIAGQIKEEIRTFASAAVPSVQATAEQAIYLSSFTPIAGASVWDGHLRAFLKPLPRDADGLPEISEQEWDAGEELLKQHNNSKGRRVFYNLSSGTGTSVPEPSRKLAPVPTDPPTATSEDLADAFGISTGDSQNDAIEANKTVATTLATKCEQLGDSSDDQDPNRPCQFKDASGNTVDGTEYLLGDIFHSNPTILLSPRNSKYFAEDLEGNGGDCKADPSENTAGGSGDPGYQCFFFRNRFRRKVLVVGSNDGMLHGFDAGLFDKGTELYDNGSGREVFAYMPRQIMPNVRDIAKNLGHRFTVDGSLAVADAFVDPENGGRPASASTGTPVADERLWRTIGVGGFREGGSGYYALDLTQPELLTEPQENRFIPTQSTDAADPECFSNSFDGTTPPDPECGPVAYGANLWSFRDDAGDSFTDPNDLSNIADGVVRSLDEELDTAGTKVGNGEPDLGDTWSRPNLGRIRICEEPASGCKKADAGVVDKYVAVFAGGMDPQNKDFDPRSSAHVTDPTANTLRGNFLYMVDLETGKVLYKRELCNPYVLESDGVCVPAGAAPSEPAAVDTDQDGYLDRIYVGTIGGFMFRTDIEADADGDFPELTTETVQDENDGEFFDVERILVDSAGDPIWVPQVIFDANFDCDATGSCTATAIPRPIYHRPAVVFVAKLGRYALTFGTGDRENLWFEENNDNAQTGRFYVFVDDSDHPDLPADSLPFTEGDFKRIVASSTNTFTQDFLTNESIGKGQRGWYLVLERKERVITDAFNLSGITVFSSFVPDVTITDTGSGDGGGGGGGNTFTTDLCTLDDDAASFDPADTDNVCSKTGQSRLFVVNTTNANPFVTDDSDPDNPTKTRFTEQDAFVTNPFVEPPSKTADDTTTPVCDPATQQGLIAELQKNFPSTCRFANYTQDVQTIRDDTQVVCIAPIPVCLQERNWKEF